MLRIRVLPLFLALCLMVPLGANGAEIRSGDEYCFSPEDFSLEEKELKGICITEVPEKTGQVLLGSRVIRPGDTLSADRLAELTFAPADTETDTDAQVGYLPIYSGEVGSETTLTLAIRGKENKSPVAEDSALETYKNLENTGKLKVKDPEGEPMTFTVVRQPKRGTVVIAEDGSFTYTPKKNKVGIDSFTYTARDAAGKDSREATVTITILKPTDSGKYTDTTGKSCCFAAEWMKNTGIFIGESIAGSACFSPERTVTRGEFVTMLVKTLNIPVEEEVSYTGYADAPDWLKPYLAAAARAGLTRGMPEGDAFGADESMVPEDAAALLCAALDLTGQDGDAAALNEAGIPAPEGEALNRAQTAELLYRLSVVTEQTGRPRVWQS